MWFAAKPTSRYIYTNVLSEGFYDIVVFVMLVNAICENFEICLE
jgi:hypothetical protein